MWGADQQGDQQRRSTSDCVMLISATRRLPCARLIDATTEPPMPNISPSPVPSVKSGATMTEGGVAADAPPTKIGDDEHGREDHAHDDRGRGSAGKFDVRTAEIDTVSLHIPYFSKWCKSKAFGAGKLPYDNFVI